MKIEDIVVGKKYGMSYTPISNAWEVIHVGRQSVFVRRSDGVELLMSCSAIEDWEEKKEPEYRWVNLYNTRAGVCHTVYNTTRSEADRVVNSQEKAFPGKKRIAVIRLDINTGDVTAEKI